MPKCCILTCTSSDENGNEMFDFPTESDQNTNWLSILGQACLINGQSNRLCSIHFKEDQFEVIDGKKQLKPAALPSRYISTVKLKSAMVSKMISVEVNKISSWHRKLQIFREIHPVNSWPHPDFLTTILKVNHHYWPDKFGDIMSLMQKCKMCQLVSKDKSQKNSQLQLLGLGTSNVQQIKKEIEALTLQTEKLIGNSTTSVGNSEDAKISSITELKNTQTTIEHLCKNLNGESNKKNVEKDNDAISNEEKIASIEICKDKNSDAKDLVRSGTTSDDTSVAAEELKELLDHTYCKPDKILKTLSSSGEVIDLTEDSISLLEQIYTRGTSNNNIKTEADLSKIKPNYEDLYKSLKLRKTQNVQSPSLVNSLVPNPDSMPFLALFGLENAVDYVKGSKIPSFFIMPFKCSRCKKDYSPTWTSTNRNITCHACTNFFYKKNLKFKNIYQARLKQVVKHQDTVVVPNVRVQNTSRYVNKSRISKIVEKNILEHNQKKLSYVKGRNPTSSLNADQIKEFKVSVQHKIDQLKKDIKDMKMPASTSSWVLKQRSNDIATAKAVIRNSGINKMELLKQQQKVQNIKNKFPSSFDLLQSITRGQAHNSRKERTKNK